MSHQMSPEERSRRIIELAGKAQIAEPAIEWCIRGVCFMAGLLLAMAIMGL